MNQIKFVADLRSEFKRLAWLDKLQLVSQLKVVLLSILVVGFMVTGSDILTQSVLSAFSWALKWIIG